MREGISVKLVRDEQSEDDYRDGIIPEPTPQKANDQPELNNSVVEQIECHEPLRADRKILDRMEQRVCNYVVRVFSKFFLGNP